MMSEDKKKQVEKEWMERLEKLEKFSCKHPFVELLIVTPLYVCLVYITLSLISKLFPNLFDMVLDNQTNFLLFWFVLISLWGFFYFLPLIAGRIYKKWYAKQRRIQGQIEWEERKRSPRYFYEECVFVGCDGSFSPADLARMRMTAERKGFPTSDAEMMECFSAGKRVVEEENRKKREETEREEKRQLIEKLSPEEEEIAARNRRYMGYEGSDKRIKICEEKVDYWQQELSKQEEEAAKIEKTAESVYRGMARKEGDWGLLGGAASGLAGGAAGLAVAMDVQRQNAEIRNHNAQVAQDVATMSMLIRKGMEKKCSISSSNWSMWLDARMNAENMLVEFLPQDQLLEALHPELIGNVEVSPTGAVRMRVKVQPGDILIYESVPAIVDGFFRADLHLEGEKVGEAVFGLWLDNGARDYRYKKETELEGVCLKPTKAAQSYDVTFSPIKLWGAEKK